MHHTIMGCVWPLHTSNTGNHSFWPLHSASSSNQHLRSRNSCKDHHATLIRQQELQEPHARCLLMRQMALQGWQSQLHGPRRTRMLLRAGGCSLERATALDHAQTANF